MTDDTDKPNDNTDLAWSGVEQTDHTPEDEKGSRKTRLMQAIPVALVLLITGAVIWFRYGPGRDPIIRHPLKRASISQLSETTMAASLEEPISGKTIIWCAALQVSWNLYADTFGEISAAKGSPAEDLNRRLVTVNDLPPKSYVAEAGKMGPELLARVDQKLYELFQDRTIDSFHLRNMNIQYGSPVAYSYILRELLFEHKFNRDRRGLFFSTGNEQKPRPMEAFGLKDYSPSNPEMKKIADQVDVFDYRSADDFIIRIRVMTQDDDELILAKIPPGPSLLNTLKSIDKRMKESKPEKMQSGLSLLIPAFNFQVSDFFDEIGGSVYAIQMISFKMDREGVRMHGVASVFSCISMENLIFDRPFMIVMKRKGSELPYFAMWVANAELMCPFMGN
ncbi:MAG: hypothetical protein CVV64_15295 [Candidatus Wallbacteria bacterium HGW-Wallbacteria-1]|uniref:Serpin domain-containing protein n=1 Tax=Candidatus Wallbacteria bacterium HGW-Wallbacteria-1 TaxID=2013854 RepID=A0A2N1PLF0_9BACT|nr:MAG: hypothetical protein CVV64_15295 [Candidatus Wallbacteria bacterium HGW-Wallbacteria-1]